MWWVAPLFSAVGQSQQKKPARYQRTADEDRMLKELERKAKEGFNVQDRVSQAIRPALDIRDHSRAKTLGTSFQRGMQNSIITDELMRKIDRGAQEQVTALSQQIAQQNQQYKDNYQGQVTDFYMREGDKGREANSRRRQFENERAMNYSNIAGNFVSGGLSSGWKFDEGFGQGTQESQGSFDINSPPSNSKDLKSWLVTGMLKYDSNSDEYIKLTGILQGLK